MGFAERVGKIGGEGRAKGNPGHKKAQDKKTTNVSERGAGKRRNEERRSILGEERRPAGPEGGGREGPTDRDA